MYVLNLGPPTLSYVCMYVCVCVCVCMYVCMYVNVSLYVHLCIYIYRLATVSKEGRMTHPFLNRHLTKGVGGELRSHTQKLLKLSLNPLHYTRKLSKCQNINIFLFHACLSLQERQDDSFFPKSAFK